MAIDFTLTNEQLDMLKHALKTDERKEVQQRGRIIHLLHLGYKPKEVAEMVDVTFPSVYTYWHRFQEMGPEGLVRKEVVQPPRKMTPEYVGALEDALNRSPSEFDYEFAIWTIERLQAHLHQQTGITISLNWLAEKMKEIGYAYRRPKHDLSHLQDPDKKAAAAELLEEMKKKSSTTISNSSLWTKPN